MNESQTYAEAVGIFLQNFRSDHNLTLDAVARAGREFGASWGVASIRNIEAGKSTASLPNLITLALALVKLTGAEIRLHELLGAATSFSQPQLAGHPVKREWLTRILSGAPIVIGYGDVVGGDAHKNERDAKNREEFEASITEMRSETLPAWVSPVEVALFKHIAPTLAEQRAAAKLGISTAVLIACSLHLWGARLDHEAFTRANAKASRAGGEVTPQARGAMTRELVLEIRKAIGVQDHGSPA